MVTTRSADQSLSADGRTESLALRSKSEAANSLANTATQSDVSSTSSSRKRANVSATVSPSRKRTRLSHNEASDAKQESTNAEATATTDPISNPSILTRSQAESFALQSDFVSLGDEVDRDGDDDDQAPEVESTRARRSSGQSKHRRKGKAEKLVAIDVSDDSVPVQHQKPSSTPGETKSELLPQLQPSSVSHPSHDSKTMFHEQHINSITTPGSNDSNDDSFETARTSKQTDVFAPAEDEPFTPSSPTRHAATATDTQPLTSPSQENLNYPVSKLILLDQPDLQSTAEPVTFNATALPPETHTSLEVYRRQVLQNRVDKASRSRGGGRFRMQKIWSGKRRRFVLGY